MFVLGTLGSDSGAGQCQTLPVLPVTGPGQPTWSYKVIHSLWLPLQSLSVCEKDHAMHQDWLLPALGLGTGQQKSQVTPTFTFTCLHLPEAVQAHALKEPVAYLGCMR